MTDTPVEHQEVSSILTRPNEGLIGPLVQHSIEESSSYPLSKVAQIINRSSLGNYNSPDGYVRKGQITSKDIHKEYGIVLRPFADGIKQPRDHVIDTAGRKIIYPGFTYPGWSYGRELFDTLDQRIDSLGIGEMPEEEKFQAIAFASASVVAIHAFRDGNKRTARGVAAFLIEKYTNRSLDMVKLRDREQELTAALIRTQYRLLPGKYNPQALFREMQGKGETEREVVIPAPSNDLSGEVSTFLKDYSDSIGQFITTAAFPIPEDSPYLSVYNPIKALAALYRESCKEKASSA